MGAKRGSWITPPRTDEYSMDGPQQGEIELLFGHEFNFRRHCPSTTTKNQQNERKPRMLWAITHKNRKVMHVCTRKLIKAITLSAHALTIHFPLTTPLSFPSGYEFATRINWVGGRKEPPPNDSRFVKKMEETPQLFVWLIFKETLTIFYSYLQN